MPSKPAFSASRAQRLMVSNFSTGSDTSARSIRQPCGTKMPSFSSAKCEIHNTGRVEKPPRPHWLSNQRGTRRLSTDLIGEGAAYSRHQVRRLERLVHHCIDEARDTGVGRQSAEQDDRDGGGG